MLSGPVSQKSGTMVSKLGHKNFVHPINTEPVFKEILS